MAVFQRWEDYNLPEIRMGKQRNQSEQYNETSLFDGPFFREKKTDDTVTTWRCSIICDMRQTRVFKDFIYSVIGTNANYFYKDVKTERGTNPQLVRIISGIPQPRQLSHNTWSYEFTLEAADFNFTTESISVETELPKNYIRDFSGMDEMIRGTAGGTPTNDVGTISFSRNRRTVFYGYLGGGASLSKNLGTSWQPTPVTGVSGGSLQDVISSAISDDGSKILVGLSSGYGAISNDNGVSWQAVERGFGMPDVTSNINTISMSGDGLIIFIGSTGGQISVSPDGGETWVATTGDFGTGEQSLNFTCSGISRDGDIIVAGTSQGYALISINSGETFSALPYGLVSGSPSSGIDILDCAISDSGAVQYFSMRDTVNDLNLIARTTKFGSVYEYTTTPSITSNNMVRAISCSPEGSNVIASWGDSLFKSFDFCDSFEQFSTGINLDSGDVLEVESDGQSCFSGYGGGYAARNIPTPAEINGFSDKDEEKPEIFTEVDLSVVPSGAGATIYSLGHPHTKYNTGENDYFIGMSDGYIIKKSVASSLGDVFVQPFGELSTVDRIESSYNYSTVFASVGSSLPVSYDRGQSFVDVQNKVSSVVGGSYESNAIGLSNDGKYFFVAPVGETGNFGLGVISVDYGCEFSPVEFGYNALIETVKDSVVSTDGKYIFVIDNLGRAALSQDFGTTFEAVTRWQNSGASATSNLVKLCGSVDGSILYVFYDDGYAAVSTTYGVGWTALPRWIGNDSVVVNDVDCSNSGEYLMAVYNSGQFTVSYDFGQTWQIGTQTIPETTPENLTKVRCIDSQWLIVTDQGRLFVGEENVIV